MSDHYLRTLELFVHEEQEHARLLGLVLDALEVPRLRTHWTERVFVHVRRFRSLRSEVLTLLVAEVIALTYYGALRDGTRIPELSEILDRIHADEVVHVQLHGQTLPPYLRQLGPVGMLLARTAWNLLVIGASVVVALDHGAALAEAGLSRWQFFKAVQRDRRRLDQRLFGKAGQLGN